jgi:hypothetical protein
MLSSAESALERTDANWMQSRLVEARAGVTEAARGLRRGNADASSETRGKAPNAAPFQSRSVRSPLPSFTPSSRAIRAATERPLRLKSAELNRADEEGEHRDAEQYHGAGRGDDAPPPLTTTSHRSIAPGPSIDQAQAL